MCNYQMCMVTYMASYLTILLSKNWPWHIVNIYSVLKIIHNNYLVKQNLVATACNWPYLFGVIFCVLFFSYIRVFVKCPVEI